MHQPEVLCEIVQLLMLYRNFQNAVHTTCQTCYSLFSIARTTEQFFFFYFLGSENQARSYTRYVSSFIPEEVQPIILFPVLSAGQK